MLLTVPLSLYIHLPWCVRKCPYCDFNSHHAPSIIPEKQYIDALIRDLDEQLPTIWGRCITSIFLGGGTPSLFSAQSIERILTAIYARLRCVSGIEVTLEANPGTMDESRFADFRSAGINRLSIGIQSLQENQLIALGRIHGREAALRAIDHAIEAGFDNFNVDLMHGLPQQSLANGLDDLKEILAFKPPHLSWYQLTIEPNTFFYYKPPVLPEEDILADIQEQGRAIIFEHGLNQYEVSAYTQKNRACMHNKNYWEFGDYLGIGAGAHSKLTDIAENRVSRHWQVKHPQEYLNPQKKLTAKQIILSPADIRFEFMLNVLRLTKGVPTSLFTERTGLDIAYLEPMLSIAKNKKLLIDNPNQLCATRLGQRFLNNLVTLFLP